VPVIRTIASTYYIYYYYYYYYSLLYTSPNECVCLCGYLRPLFKHCGPYALGRSLMFLVNRETVIGRTENQFSPQNNNITPLQYSFICQTHFRESRRTNNNGNNMFCSYTGARDSNSQSASNDHCNHAHAHIVCVCVCVSWQYIISSIGGDANRRQTNVVVRQCVGNRKP